MAVTVTKKIDYKLKKVSFNEGQLIDENGEVIDLIEDLKKIFKSHEFDLSVSLTNKSEYDIEDFAE